MSRTSVRTSENRERDPLATPAEEKVEVGSPTSNKGIRRGLLPSAAFSYKQRNEVTDVKILTEKTEKPGPDGRGRREEAGLGPAEHPGAGLTRGRGSLGPAVQDLQTPREGRGEGGARAGLPGGAGPRRRSPPRVR